MEGTLHGGSYGGKTVPVDVDSSQLEDWIRIVMLPPVKPLYVGNGFYGFDQSAVEVYMRDGETLDYYYDKTEKW